MAKPAKRRVEGTGSTGGSGTGATSADRSASAGGASSPTSKRVTPKADQRPSGRYTPPRTGAVKGPSPRWVPILMFGLWGLGLLVIVLNYMGVLPGSSDGGNGWYLVTGLAAILGGIMVATQYR
jgi:hypothetical protein